MEKRCTTLTGLRGLSFVYRTHNARGHTRLGESTKGRLAFSTATIFLPNTFSPVCATVLANIRRTCKSRRLCVAPCLLASAIRGVLINSRASLLLRRSLRQVSSCSSFSFLALCRQRTPEQESVRNAGTRQPRRIAFFLAFPTRAL